MGAYTEEMLAHMTQAGTGSPRFSGQWCQNSSGREVYCGSWQALVDMTSNGRGDICTRNGGAGSIIGWLWVDIGANHNAPNSKLQLKDYQAWVLRRSTNTWELLWAAGVGSASCWDNGGNQGAAINGSYSKAIHEGNGIYTPNRTDFAQYGLEYWPTGGVDAGIRNTGLLQDAKAIHVRALARRALINASGNDDRASARFRGRQGWDIGNASHPGWSGANPVAGGGFTRPEKIDLAVAIGDYTRAYPGYAMDGGSGRWIEIPYDAADPDRWYIISGTAVQCAQITGYYGAWAYAEGRGQYTGQTPYGRDSPYVLTAAEFRANPPPDPDTGGTTAPPVAYRVLSIGDSITAGSNDGSYQSWRGRLQQRLTAKPYTHDMLGPNTDGAGGGADPQHAAWGGACIDSTGDAANNLTSRLDTLIFPSGTNPNIVVVGPVGWNDYYKGGTIQSTADTRLSTLLAAIRTRSSSAKMIVCTLHPERGTASGSMPAAWQDIVNAAKAYCTANPTFAYVADLSAITFAAADYTDSIHLSASGAQKVGDAIFNAFEVAIGAAAVPPEPITPGLPTRLRWFTSDAGGKLQWGATGQATSAPVFITDSPLPNAAVGTAYTATIQANGSPTPTYAVQSGSLPAGLSLNGTTGAITGTPSAAGTSTFTIRATGTGTADKSYSITVVASPVWVTTTLPAPVVGVAYSTTLSASGSTPISFSLATGTLPPGLALSAGVLSGTPTVAGTYGFTLRATNAAGSTDQSFSVVVSARPVITTTTLPQLVQGQAVSIQLQATGQGPIAWSVPAAQLPSGLTLSAQGLLSGTPTTLGSGSMTVSATNPAGTTTQVLAWTVATSGQAPTITTTSLADAIVGLAHSAAIATTGSTPKTFSIIAGALPPGLSLNASTGAITGTPTAVGGYAFTVRVSNAYSPPAEAQLSLRVLSQSVTVGVSPWTAVLKGR
jgi:lysophospholipase L1-like esterase